MNAPRRLPKSTVSNQTSFVLLANGSQRQVDVYWLDYAGSAVLYNRRGAILPTKHIALNTFSTHPWIILDHFTGDPMHVAHEEIFWPPPWFHNVAQLPEGHQVQRKRCIIHLPMRTLRDIASSIVCDHVPTILHLSELDIPFTLVEYLKHKYNLRQGWQKSRYF